MCDYSLHLLRLGNIPELVRGKTHHSHRICPAGIKPEYLSL